MLSWWYMLTGATDNAGAEWTEDIDAAEDQATAWVKATADSKNWMSEWTSNAAEFIEGAANGAASAEDFWQDLADEWQSYDSYASRSGVGGWSELGSTFANAGGATYLAEEADAMGGWWDQLKGAWGATEEDLEEIAETVKEKSDWRLSPWPWVLGAAGLAGLVWVIKK